MNVVVCDLCRKQILSKTWATATFPKVVDGNNVVEYYQESDICHTCSIALATSAKVKVEFRKPVEPEAKEDKPNVQQSSEI